MSCPACNWEYTNPEDGSSCAHCGLPFDVEPADRGLSYTPTVRYAAFAWEAFENADLTAESEGIVSEPPVTAYLRRLDSRPVAVLARAGYNALNVGISVTGKRAWQRKRGYVQDTQLYDYLVRDAVECALAFWQSYRRYEDTESFIEAALNGKFRGSDSEENVAKTFVWLRDEVEAPTTLTDHQASLNAW